MGQETQSGWLLAVVEGPDFGRVCLLGEEPVAIGRGRDDVFVLRDACVTSRQLVIEWDPITSRHILQQAGDSATVINNIPLSRLAGVKHALLEGDQIQVGGTIMRYRCRLPAEDRWVCPFCGQVADLETVLRPLCRSRTCACGAVVFANRPCDFDEITDDAIGLFAVEIRPESRGHDLELRRDILRSGVEIRPGAVCGEELIPGHREDVHYVWFRRQETARPAEPGATPDPGGT